MTTTLPTWDEMSDVDKGAALLHLHKRDSEGADYAVENYPVVYYDDPRLTALESREACRHAVSVSRDADRISGKEHQRLCNLALDEPARRCLWAARNNHGRIVCSPYAADPRAEAISLLTEIWPMRVPESDRGLFALLTRDVPGGEWREVPRSEWAVA